MITGTFLITYNSITLFTFLFYSEFAVRDPTDRALPPWMVRHNNSQEFSSATDFGASAWDAGNSPMDLDTNSLAENNPQLLRGAKTRPSDSFHGRGLHLLVPTFDGHIYVIEALSGCAERIDVGERVVTMPLLDDVTNDGYLDMLIGTMSGELLLFDTSVPYHPLNSWSSYPKHRLNGFTHGNVGISIPADAKMFVC